MSLHLIRTPVLLDSDYPSITSFNLNDLLKDPFSESPWILGLQHRNSERHNSVPNSGFCRNACSSKMLGVNISCFSVHATLILCYIFF